MGLWLTVGIAIAVVLAVAAGLDVHNRRRGVHVDPAAVHARRKHQTRQVGRALLPGSRARDERPEREAR